MNENPASADPKSHQLSRRQVVLAFGLMIVAVVLGYFIIERSLQREQRKRPQPMWEAPPAPKR